MEKLNKLGRYSTRVFNRLKSSPAKEETALLNFVTDFREEKFSIIWRIENIHRCNLKCEEFLESPSFSTGFSKEVKWTLRFYPKGRIRKTSNRFSTADNALEWAGLFIKRNSADTVTSSFKYRFVCEAKLLNNTQKHSTCCYPDDGVADIIFDSTKPSEYGTDGIILTENLKTLQTFIVRCDVYVTNVYNMETSNMCLTGFSKSESLSQDLKAIYDSGKFSDVTLEVGDAKFPAHKVILASRSQVFDAMFQHDMKESQTNTVRIENIEPALLGHMLQYIYTGSIDDFNTEKAIALYSVADRYFLEELKKWCVDVMLANLKVENVCQIAVLADLHPDAKLKEAILNMFRNYTSDIFKRKEWQNLVRDSDRRTLVSDILQAVSANFTTNCSDIK